MMSVSLKPIHLSETLESLSLDDLKRFAGLLGIAPAQTSKARLIRDIPVVLNAGIPEDLGQKLSSYPCEGLAIVLALEEYGAFLGPGIRRYVLDYLSEKLVGSHPLLADIEDYGGYRVFAEFIPIARLLCGAVNRVKPYGSPDKIVVFAPETIINDIYSIWASLSKRPIKLTKKDTPKKRQLEGLLGSLLIDEDEPVLSSIQSFFSISRFELLFAFMQKQRILRVNGDLLEANSVFPQSIAPDLPEIGRLLIEMITGREGAAAVGLAISAFSNADEWLNIADLLSKISGITSGKGTSSVKSVIFALFVSGYIAIGRKGRYFFARREREFVSLPLEGFRANEPDIIVGSNFEVKVPANTDPAIRAKIEAFAELRKPDIFYDYEINKGSIYGALDSGITADEMIASLREYSKHPVPQNVEFAISNWERQFGSLGFEKGLFLVAADKATADELAGLSEVIGGDGEVVELFGIRIDEDDYERVREYLRQMGFLPRSLPRKVQQRPGEGDVSALFRGYHDTPETPTAAGINKQSVLRHSIEFTRKKGGRIKLELRDGETVYGEPISFKTSRGETVVAIDCGGETINVVLSDVADFTLD